MSVLQKLKEPEWIIAIGTVILVALTLGTFGLTILLVPDDKWAVLRFYHWPLVAIPLIVVGGMVIAAVLNLKAARQRTRDTLEPPQKLQDTSPRWYEEMVKDDSKKMNQRILAVKWEPHRVFESSDPYVDFAITFVNATVFHLKKPQIIHGKAKFRRQPLTSPPQLEQPFAMPHGDKTWIRVRQFLSSGMAREIQELINSGRGQTVLDFSEVHIIFETECPNLPPGNFDWVGIDNVSLTEVTTI
jgi:hypothetical protein